MQPKDTTINEACKGFTHTVTPLYQFHPGVKREFNCLFCYCALSALECSGDYRVFTSANGVVPKDCSACTLLHNGYRQSWQFIQTLLEHPVHWNGLAQTRRCAATPGGAVADAPAAPPAVRWLSEPSQCWNMHLPWRKVA